jgi:hypothetical protein
MKKINLALQISTILKNKNSVFYQEKPEEKPDELPLIESLTIRQKNTIVKARRIGVTTMSYSEQIEKAKSKVNGFSLALCAIGAATKSVVNQIQTFNKYAELVSPTIKDKVDKT